MTKKPLYESDAIQSADHNAGMHLVTGTITRLTEVSDQLCRVTLRAPEIAQDPTWTTPNVALRFRVGDGADQVSRVYTVRSCSVDDSAIDVDVVRHGTPSPMMDWLDRIEVGHTVDFVGPRPHFRIPEPNGRPVALFCDDTAIPALYAILQQPPADLAGIGWIATGDQPAFDELPQLPGLELRRIAPGQGFAAQLAELDAPEGHVVWAAGERDDMREIRSFFRTDCGLAKEDVSVFGYWKRGTSTTRIDQERLRAYEQALASGGTVTDLDDLALTV